METCLLDRAFLIHSQPSTDMAEQRFRLKWLSGDASQVQDSVKRDGNTISVSLGSTPQDPSKIEDILWNVGAALSGLRNHSVPLQLTEKERKYIADVAELWAKADILPRSLSFFPAAAAEPTRWAIRGLASILAEGVVPKSVGERIYEKVKSLDDSRTRWQLANPLFLLAAPSKSTAHEYRTFSLLLRPCHERRRSRTV